jgi:hypothetical protein
LIESASDERARVVAVADSALAAITRGDQMALTDLMVPEAQTVAALPDSTGGRYRVRTFAENRSRPIRGVVERGWNPTAQVSGPVAVVWYPYDLYVDGTWSHCGVDVFTLVRQGAAWRIATLAYSIEQPPACTKHPAGPPR